ncbi:MULTISPECIES: AAA family ATPase [unclassified Variovorax]|uniref:ParA family protein n=1 Tax=unclassified Variovorax TaxID=663243 RepID=UPI00083874BF|nr:MULTISPECIES: AAA family ATPase [unclassified Variovorax]PNG48907.1 Sporulation initiation inhibitor protein Soj [Variovorax sp. B2]PNG49414.1 Sporulation initiation inhibitor protein Soj [Variovorax sp. B4]
MTKLKLSRLKSVSIQDITDQAEKATDMMGKIRSAMLAPTARKSAPTFNLSQLSALCGAERGSILHRLSKGGLPSGNLNPSGSRREFTLAESREWIREYRKEQRRPQGAEAVTISVGNFKGGVTKTTTAVTLAQGLSLRGHRVLMIDVDPQGSATTLFGILPDTEVEEDQTVLGLALGTESSIRYAIRPTYWDGIDIVAAAPLLFGGEFALPARQSRDPEFEFWSVLDLAIDDVRSEYDVIIIDTPPALSYMTIAAFMASDGIIIPLPPNPLDFASAAQFWNLFSDIAQGFKAQRGYDKNFAFMHILLARVDSSDSASNVVRQWIGQTYAEKVLPVEIPKTAVASSSSAEFGTVYDVAKYDGNARTFKRARDAYDTFVEYVEGSVREVWDTQVEEGANAAPVKPVSSVIEGVA